MAQAGFTPVSFYHSTTPAAAPTAGNLVNGEIAVNTADGIIYYKNSGGVVSQLSFGLIWQPIKTANFTAVAGEGYPINTTGGAITVTLPATPSLGDIVVLVDDFGTFATNNLTINPNGSKLLGASGNVKMSTNRESLAFVYIDATQGWLPYDGFNASIPAPASYTVNYLAVGGGGGGCSYPSGSAAGGGGAGGLLTGTTSLSIGTVYTVTVGAGGVGGIEAVATAGANSVFKTITAIGGGSGGRPFTQNGGSGGGAGYASSPGSGTAGQGNNGGSGQAGPDSRGGGGGGAGFSGGSATSTTAGAGGDGVQSSITGTAVYYAGGGQGGIEATGTGWPPALGGGGTGGVAGTNGLGGGGGGGGTYSGPAGNGGSGVVILSVPTANYSGTTTGSPTVSTSGSNTILTFTSSGSYTA